MSEAAETKPICSICEEPHWPYEHHVWLPLAVYEARAAAKAQAEAEERRRADIVTKPADDQPEVAEFPESYARARARAIWTRWAATRLCLECREAARLSSQVDWQTQ